MLWETWKKGFEAWESATAKYFDSMLKSPLVLGSSGSMLTSAMKAKAAYEKSVAMWWATMGLPTRHDQERSLHALNQLESRLLDLEEKIAELSQPQERDAKPAKRNGTEARSRGD
jgi:hypothetical protein